MLRKLRRKFIGASMLALTIVLVLIIGAINLFNYRSIVVEADRTIKMLMLGNEFPSQNQNDKLIPSRKIEFAPELPQEQRYFTVKFSKDGKTATVDDSNITGIEAEDAKKMAESIIKYRRNKGFAGYYRYAVDRSADGVRVVFLDCMMSLDNGRTFLLISLLISGVVLLAELILLLIFSDRIVQPISDSFEKQKRFITNAGHDIKTPLTIIDADAELIEMDIGDNEWLSDIRKQTKRLSSLTSELIYLSRMEELESAPQIEFPIGDLAEDVVRSFGAPAKSKSIVIEADIQKSISYVGDEDSIRKLFAILFDNAVKYSPEGESIKFSIKKHNRNTLIRISNTSENLSDEAVEHMFDRFYRSDSARSSSGGFGIGLSVASAIVSAHKGKISASKIKDALVIDIVL